MTAFVLVLLGQFTSSLNGQPLTAIVCDGGVVCSRTGSVARIVVTGGGGGGGGGVTSVTASPPLASSGGATPNVSLTGTVAGANGGLGATQPTCAGGQFLTCNGTTCSCATPSGGGGSGNFVEVDIDFGAGAPLATAVVTGQTWVSGSTRIVCAPTMVATSTRAEGEDDAVAERLVVATHSRVAGVGFTVVAAPSKGLAYGVFKVHCTGG